MSQPAIAPADALRPVLETALDAVVVMDARGIVLDWNSAAEATFGWTAADAIGRLMAGLIIPPQYRDAHNEGLARYLATGHGPVLRKRIEISALHKSGHEFPIELSITPTETGAGSVFLGFLRDISERRRAEGLMARQLRDATSLSRITAVAAQTDSLEEALSVSLESICEISGWPIGHAWISSGADPGQFRSSGVWRLAAPERFRGLIDATERMEFSAGIGLPGQALSAGEPVWMADLAADHGFVRSRLSGDLGIRAGFAFPVTCGTEVIAVLEFFSERPAKPDPDLMLTVRAIGDQVGRVFERIRSEEMLRAEKQALEQEVRERKRIEEHQTLLLAELNHRVKNMLTVVMGIAAQTARASSSIESFSESFSGRLSSLSRTYTLLTAANWGNSPLGGLVDELLSAHALLDDGRCELRGPPLMLDPRTALAMSMILHELITNALKYGALAVPDGRISLTWRVERAGETERVLMRWRETGVPLDGPPKRAGFGSRMMEATIRHELSGRSVANWHPDGAEYLIEFPLQLVRART